MGKFCSCQKAHSLIPEKLPGMLVPVKYGAQSGHRSFIDLVCQVCQKRIGFSLLSLCCVGFSLCCVGARVLHPECDGLALSQLP